MALLFLTRGDWNQPGVWEDYIAGGSGKFSVYCHPKSPDRVGSPQLRDAIIGKRVPTDWGCISLVRATLLLLRAALESDRNRFFVLLSESCVPIKPPGRLFAELSVDGRSWIGWQHHGEVAATNPVKGERVRDARGIPLHQWRFQQQWMLLNRSHAEALCSADFVPQFLNVFAPDEAYFATVLEILGISLGAEVRNRCPTFTQWVKPSRAHPIIFKLTPPGLSRSLIETEQFFARKFDPSSDICRLGLHLSERG